MPRARASRAASAAASSPGGADVAAAITDAPDRCRLRRTACMRAAAAPVNRHANCLHRDLQHCLPLAAQPNLSI